MLDAGTAGEHIACAELLIAGHRAFLAPAGCPYDVLADIGGRFYRVAVKSTAKPRQRTGRNGSREKYLFSVCRGRSGRATKGTQPYKATDVDLVALIALDTKLVGWLALKNCPSCIDIEAPHGAPGTNNFGPRGKRSREFDELTLASALEDFHG